MFKGRIGIKDYWFAAFTMLFVGLGWMLAVGILGLGASALFFHGISFLAVLPIIIVLWVIPFLVMIPFSIGLQIRRFHDFNRSVWWWVGFVVLSIIVRAVIGTPHSGTSFSALSGAVTLLYTIASIAILCIPGTKGSNTFGAVTKYANMRDAILGKPVQETSDSAVQSAAAPSVTPDLHDSNPE